MAFDITNMAIKSPIDFDNAARATVTDATGNTTASDFTVARRNFRAYVAFSPFTEGDAGAISSVALEVSDVANFASNVDTLDVRLVTPAAINGLPAFTLGGQTPLLAGKRYARISISLGTNAAGNFDAIIDAV